MTAVTVSSSAAGIGGAQDIGHNLSLLLNYLRVFVILSFAPRFLNQIPFFYVLIYLEKQENGC